MPTEEDIKAQLRREEQLDALDPLRHFLATDDFNPTTTDDGVTGDIRDAPSSNDYSIVPQQIESIIDRRATIRYYRDLGRRPELISHSDHKGEEEGKGEEKGEGEYWDVHLKLDMTTGCGGKIWPAAEVLGAYIASKYSHPEERRKGEEGNEGKEAGEKKANVGYNKNNFDWRQKTIIELGSGTGLVGYLVHALSLCSTRIFVTDQEAMLALMRENLLLNFPTSSPSTVTDPTTNGFVQVAELDWSHPPESIFTNPMPDVLLLADCVYLESAFQPLIDTMTALSGKQTEILFCYQKRRKADKRFFALLKKGFVFEDVTDDDEERMKEYRRQGTQLLRIRKK